MKATGIVRRLDELGRVVIPIELRREYGIEERDPIEIFTEGKNIILRKYDPLPHYKDDIENMLSKLANDDSPVKRKKEIVQALRELKKLME